MEKDRLEAFSDGIIGVAITLMVLELKPPALAGGLSNLVDLAPALLTYVLSFVYIGILLEQSPSFVPGGSQDRRAPSSRPWPPMRCTWRRPCCGWFRIAGSNGR